MKTGENRREQERTGENRRAQERTGENRREQERTGENWRKEKYMVKIENLRRKNKDQRNSVFM